MKIGCSVLNEDEVKIAREAGFDYVEFKGRYLADLNGVGMLKVIKTLKDDHMTCYGINAYCGPSLQMAGDDYNPLKTRDYAKDMAEKISSLGAKVVGVGSPFSRRLAKGYDRETAFLQMQEFLEITAETFAPFGITVCLEPLAPVYCDLVNTAGEACEIIEKIPGSRNLGIVIDYYSMELSGESEGDYMPYFDRIKHVHMSDDLGDPFKRSYFLPEKKELHKQRLLFLYHKGYQGNVTLEMDLPADAERSKDSRSYFIQS